jgi:hypothetical protein
MRGRAYIHTPFPTPEQTAEVFGVGRRRTQQLIQMVEETLAKKGYSPIKKGAENGTEKGADKSTGAAKNGADDRLSRRQNSKVKIRARSPRSASRRKSARAKAKSSH